MDTGNFSSAGPSGEEPGSFEPSSPHKPPSSEGASPGAPPERQGRAQRPGRSHRNRRGRGRKGPGGHPNHPQGGQATGGRHGHRPNGHGGHRSRNAVFTGPMDHSYRQNGDAAGNDGNSQNSNRGNQRRFRGGGGHFRQQFGKGRGGEMRGQNFAPQGFQETLEPVPFRENATTRIFAFIEDLFFVSKITETARKLNVKVEFVKSLEELLERTDREGEEKPSLVIFDLNNVNAKPLAAIPKLKSKFKKDTSILGFVSHVQGELKLKALEAGCDSVMPRSAFSQNLPQLLRRHGAPEDLQAG